MRALFAIAILLILLTIISSCKNVVVIGGDTIITNGGSKGQTPSPGYDAGIIGSPITDFRDPSKYGNPYVNLVPHPENNNTNPQSNYGVSITSLFSFDMSGDIYGNGTFNEWRSIKNGEKSSAKQADSATVGSVHIIRADYVVSEHYTDYDLVSTQVRNRVTFIGQSYRERECYSADGTRIQNYFRSGLIKKDSVYAQISEQVRPDNDTFYRNTATNSISYLLGANFQGTNSFKVVANNSSEVSQDLTGVFSLTRTLTRDMSYKGPVPKDSWLPCCSNLTFSNMQTQSQQF